MRLVLDSKTLSGNDSRVLADAFCATRLEGDWGTAFGTLPPAVDTASIIARHAVPR